MSKNDTIESLVREVYELAAVRRDMWRRAGFEQAQTIAALNAVRRLGPVRVSAVAADLHVDISVASRQLAALEELGHVQRTTDPADGRSRLLAVTDAGLEALGEAHHRMVDVFVSTVADWDDDDIAGLAAGLHRLREDYARAVAEAGVAGREAQTEGAG